jgi:AmmeMemoRadiSam system protein A
MSSPTSRPTALTPEEGQWLVRLARAAIAEKLGCPPPEEQLRTLQAHLERPIFATPAGTFVTLVLNGSLRGCIGTLSSPEPLARNVRENALNAAFRDPRFPPLTADEFQQIVIEVSVLSPPEPLVYTDADDLLARIRPGVDGLIIRKGGASATFLPQVWKQLPRRQDFLAHLCLKAGLPARAWREGDLDVETYQVHYFEEEPPA